MKTKLFPIYFTLFIFTEGLVLGSLMDRETGALISKVVMGISILLLAFYGRKIEKAFHRSDMEIWPSIRLRGKGYFIVTRYLLARGIILSMVFFIPVFLSINGSRVLTITVLFGSGVLSLFLWGLGQYEWKNCETEYRISILKEAGQQVRIMQN